jgi:hypothetical protein
MNARRRNANNIGGVGVAMMFQRGLDTVEIAKRLGVPESAVANKLGAGLRELRTIQEFGLIARNGGGL